MKQHLISAAIAFAVVVAVMALVEIGRRRDFDLVDKLATPFNPGLPTAPATA